jgi:hypothetical protein
MQLSFYMAQVCLGECTEGGIGIPVRRGAGGGSLFTVS